MVTHAIILKKAPTHSVLEKQLGLKRTGLQSTTGMQEGQSKRKNSLITDTTTQAPKGRAVGDHAMCLSRLQKEETNSWEREKYRNFHLKARKKQTDFRKCLQTSAFVFMNLDIYS